MVLHAKTRATIFGKPPEAWSLNPDSYPDTDGFECIVSLSIEGDEKNGYHLNGSPEGFFTADNWYQSLDEAKNTAHEQFGVNSEAWAR